MWPNPHFPADMVTFIEEILNGKLDFLCSDKVDNLNVNYLQNPAKKTFSVISW